SVLLLPTDEIADRAAEVPGVASAEVDRAWPDGMTVTVTAAAPVAQLTRADGSTGVVDAAGEELPAAAAEGATLVPMTVQGGAADPEGAAATMSEVLASLPEPLRGAVREVSASSTSDVTLVLNLGDGGTKTVVWGEAHDAELKAEVVQALLSRPGSGGPRAPGGSAAGGARAPRIPADRTHRTVTLARLAPDTRPRCLRARALLLSVEGKERRPEVLTSSIGPGLRSGRDQARSR